MQAEPPPLVGMAQAFVDVHTVIAPKIAEQNTAHVVNLLEQFESDMAPLIAPMAQRLLANPSLPDELRPLIEMAAQPEHFGESVVIGILIGSIIGPVLQAALAPLVQGIANDAWSEVVQGPVTGGTVPLTPDLLAAATLKGVITETYGAGRAAESGVSSSDFNTMYLAAGQAIGIAEALLLYRRGQIDAAGLQAVEQYSNLNPKFYDLVPMLQYVPLSVGEVVAANLKGHLDDATAATYLGHAGIDPTFQPLLKEAAGRPLGLGEMLTLYNRGEATAADIQNTILQSDVNPDWAQFALPLAVHFPAVFQVLELVKSGAMTPDRAALILKYEGFEQVDIDAITSQSNAAPTSKAKALTQAEISRLYGAAIITEAEALTQYTAIGVPAAEQTLLIDYENSLRPTRLMNALITKVGSLYIAHKITKAEATTDLNQGAVPTAAQTQLFAVWDIERSANLHYPTPAAIVGAYRRTYITAAECKTRLTDAGVQASDLGLVVANGWPPTKGAAAVAAADAVVNA